MRSIMQRTEPRDIYDLKSMKDVGLNKLIPEPVTSEHLVLEYKTFSTTIKEISKWNKPALDVTHKKSQKELWKKFPNDLVIVLDPIDQNRNAAAGIQGTVGKILLNRLKNSSLKSIENPIKFDKPLIILFQSTIPSPTGRCSSVSP